MGGRFFLLGILLFSFLRISGQMDGVHLRMNLYPVQILSVGRGDTGRESAGYAEQKYVTVSSTTGFEISIHRRASEFGNRSIINSNKGTVYRDFVIDYNTNNRTREMYADASLKPADLILTLISQ
ncbi:hypothetical protein FY557_04920 [Chryseobacterium sp. SN22]|uniref:hypothetical protein n=1 Tax=Chryseobacterium sp. SN22 TaxID=2606431 RepID=UPI0011EDA679|nr:hypothetical protein [Chryseobacterium sp. SN22]KAA0129645.1 hypothetical protein FY557_04920 [Chryseobacterium sp. SN22]